MPPIVRDYHKFLNITTATTTVVKTTGGGLYGIVVNGGTLGSITLYDNTEASGTLIGTIASPVAGMVLPYNAKLDNGLTIVTAAATNLTVCYD
jgi:hypothetical protein